MRINEQYHDLEPLQTLSYTQIDRNHTTRACEAPVLNEHIMDVFLNDRLTMKLVCLPQHLTELVLGRLRTENVIHSVQDVDMIYICEYGKRARVYLTREALETKEPFVETTPTCCTGNHILNDYFMDHSAPLPIPPFAWHTDWVFDLADHFASGMPLHSVTWATHSCFLSRGGELLFSCEDIGRHNALDKAIGFALRNNIPLGECIVYSSGRIPTDMVMKALRAGIPVLASKAAPTEQAILLAQAYGLTLLCSARRDSMRQYTGTPPVD